MIFKPVTKYDLAVQVQSEIFDDCSACVNYEESVSGQSNYKYGQLYTDKCNNDTAIKFYKVMGCICEGYSSSSDPASMKYPTLIFFKSLGPYSVEPWNNRYINLTDQMKKRIILKEEKTYG